MQVKGSARTALVAAGVVQRKNGGNNDGERSQGAAKATAGGVDVSKNRQVIQLGKLI